jgi:hypothetical protein
VPQLRPKPFGRISVATLGDELRAMLRREPGNFGRFTPAGVVFPKPALGFGIFRPLFRGGERDVVGINRDRAGTGRIDSETDYFFRIETTRFFGSSQGAAHAFLQTKKIISRMLAGKVVIPAVEHDALISGRIINRAGAEFLAIATAHDQRADGVCAVINSEGKHSG